MIWFCWCPNNENSASNISFPADTVIAFPAIQGDVAVILILIETYSRLTFFNQFLVIAGTALFCVWQSEYLLTH